MIRVVQEEDQVTEADERVGALPRAGQVAGVAVHVAHHVDARPARAVGAGPAPRVVYRTLTECCASHTDASHTEQA
ncbi:hypothetical protein GCM10018793_15320 [Streptomyces sulfonofaciens]|uniref:Uncharacterized protein n=1 Tax=Streptomyces sulfonofaciens TaxID=68272 RepID=A0A919FXH8_9ACTN|nr:hypothetical protein GCM10018793_15320 [Streptomyces sulfonofaciens]